MTTEEAKRPDGTTTHYIPSDFARRLERERDEARKALQQSRELMARYKNELFPRVEALEKSNNSVSA